MLRGGYVAEDGIMNSKKSAEENSLDSYRTTALRGPSAGFTLELPMGNGSTFGLDYSYRHTNPFQGSHSIGARINITLFALAGIIVSFENNLTPSAKG